MKASLKKTALTTLTFLTLGVEVIFGQNSRAIHAGSSTRLLNSFVSQSKSDDFESMSLEQRMDAAKWPVQDSVTQADNLFVKNYLDVHGYQVSKYSIDNVSFIAINNDSLKERYVGLTIISDVKNKQKTYFEQSGHTNVSTRSTRKDISEVLGVPLLETSVKATDKKTFSQADADKILLKMKTSCCDDYIVSIAHFESDDKIGKKYLVVTNFDGIVREAYPGDKNSKGVLGNNINVDFRNKETDSSDSSNQSISHTSNNKGIVSVELYTSSDFNKSHGGGAAIRLRTGHKSPVTISLGYNYLQDNLPTVFSVKKDVLEPNVQGYVTSHFDDLTTEYTNINYNGSVGLIVDVSNKVAIASRLDFASFIKNKAEQIIKRDCWTSTNDLVDPTADLNKNPVGPAINSISSVPFKPAKINLGVELKVAKHWAVKAMGGAKLYKSNSPATLDVGGVYHF